MPNSIPHPFIHTNHVNRRFGPKGGALDKITRQNRQTLDTMIS